MNEDLIICRCREITKGEILEAIRSGATTVDGVKIRTSSGMGLCQGKTCEQLIAKIIAENTEKNIEDILPSTKRIPVRPVNIGVVGSCEDE